MGAGSTRGPISVTARLDHHGGSVFLKLSALAGMGHNHVPAVTEGSGLSLDSAHTQKGLCSFRNVAQEASGPFWARKAGPDRGQAIRVWWGQALNNPRGLCGPDPRKVTSGEFSRLLTLARRGCCPMWMQGSRRARPVPSLERGCGLGTAGHCGEGSLYEGEACGPLAQRFLIPTQRWWGGSESQESEV